MTDDEPAGSMAKVGTRRRRVVLAALVFEGGLAPLAMLAGSWWGVRPLESFAWSGRDAAWGVAAAFPMYALFLLGLRSTAAPLVRIRTFLDSELVPLLGGTNALEWAGIALAAGVGEEVLFRGLIQTGLGRCWGAAAGLVTTALLFGLAHPITPAYVAVAGVLGSVLGLVWIWDGNLLAAIAAHAAYDFLALATVLGTRTRRGTDRELQD